MNLVLLLLLLTFYNILLLYSLVLIQIITTPNIPVRRNKTLLLLVNFFIVLLKNIKSCQSLSYNIWISFTIIIICGTNSLYFLVSSKMSALNPLFIKNGVLLVMLYSNVLYASILIDNNLT